MTVVNTTRRSQTERLVLASPTATGGLKLIQSDSWLIRAFGVRVRVELSFVRCTNLSWTAVFIRHHQRLALLHRYYCVVYWRLVHLQF